jgi:ribosomal-protein-alanine N-acetyltransferase
MHEKGMETHRISLFYFLLFDKETQMCIGECGFHTWKKTHRRTELFYSLKTIFRSEKD